MKVLDAALWALAVLLAFVAAIILVDLFMAIGAEACGDGGGPGCYPWGAEGPASDYWFNASKELYLLRGAGVVLFSWGSLAAMILSRANRSIFARVFAGLAIGAAIHLLWF